MADAYDFWAARLPRGDQIAIDDFWQRFVELAPRVERFFKGLLPNMNVDQEIRAALGPLRHGVVADFEVGTEGELILVVTPELFHSRRPLTRAIVSRAPEIKGWAMRDVRWPVARVPEAVRAILDRSRADAIEIDDLVARRGAHRLVDLVAHGEGDREFISDQAGVIFSVLLGERADQDWLGTCNGRLRESRSFTQTIALRPRARPKPDLWLESFRASALSIIEGFEAERPEAPFAESPMRVEDCVTFRLRPIGGERVRRRDAMTYQSRYPALTAARLAGVRITGLRFSRFGEAFCGLKIERTGAHRFAEVAEIATFGTRLEDKLMAAGVGGVIGRASGIDHVYVDLALLDIDRAIAVMRRTLSDEGITGPAWLLFDEAGLEDLYHPLTAKTPATPVA